jgi:hypothetical protein
LGWNGYLRSLNELLSIWFPTRFGVGYRTGLVCFARVAWAIWNTRNKFCIRRIFPNKPIDVVLFGVSFIQKWRMHEGASEGLAGDAGAEAARLSEGVQAI